MDLISQQWEHCNRGRKRNLFSSDNICTNDSEEEQKKKEKRISLPFVKNFHLGSIQPNFNLASYPLYSFSLLMKTKHCQFIRCYVVSFMFLKQEKKEDFIPSSSLYMIIMRIFTYALTLFVSVRLN